MKRTTNYHGLYQIEKDIQRIQNESPALTFILGDKFQRFYQRNSIRLRLMNQKIQDIQNKYIQTDQETGEPKRIEVEPGKWGFVFRESLTDGTNTIEGPAEVQNAYQQEAEEFFSKQFDIEL